MEILRRNLKNYEIIDLTGVAVPVKDSILFKQTIDAIVEKGCFFIAVNFEKVNTLSSDLVGEIIAAYHRVHAQDGDFVLIGSNLKITETLQLVGISTFISIYLDEKSFAGERLK